MGQLNTSEAERNKKPVPVKYGSFERTCKNYYCSSLRAMDWEAFAWVSIAAPDSHENVGSAQASLLQRPHRRRRCD
jgi:hypothetical protein